MMSAASACDYKATPALPQARGVKGLPPEAPTKGKRRRAPGAVAARPRCHHKPAQLLKGPRDKNALAPADGACEDLIEMRNRLNPETHWAFHGYDFAIPDGRAICHLAPWLQSAFDLHGFPADRCASTQVVQEMLPRFAATLKARQAHPRPTFIDAQGVLPAVPSSWHDEMHPSEGGFDQIADLFHTQIKALFPGRLAE
jgi:hypothetical protein